MEDRVKLTADDSDYQNVMKRAGATADQFKNRIERASTGFQSLFKRTPHRRAELALTGLATSLSSGDLAGAVSSFAERLTGLGLAAGVGVGVAATLFEKFHRQIEETKEAHEALRLEMVKRPLSTVTSLSGEGMEQALGTREKLAEDLREKSSHTFGSELWAGLQTPLAILSQGAFGGSNKSEEERLQVQKDLNRATAEGKAIMLANAELSAKMFEIQKQELEGDERKAALAKIMLNTDQQRAAIKGKGLTREAEAKAEKTILQTEELALHKLDKNVALKESGLKMEEKIAALQRKGLEGDNLKMVRASLEIKSLDQQIAAETSPSAKRALQLQRSQKINEAHGFLPPAGPKNPFPFGTIASRGWESQFAYGGFAKRGIEDSLDFGGFASQSMKSGESLTPEEALLKTGTSAEDIAGYRKNVGALPGEKTKESPDVVAAIESLKTLIDQVWNK